MASALNIMREINLSVVVPFHNEQESLALLVKRLLMSIDNAGFTSYELIFINDGSTDNSELIISGFLKDNDSISLVNLSRNFGHQAALTAGLELARGDLVFALDADLQDPPELLKSMHAKIFRGLGCCVWRTH